MANFEPCVRRGRRGIGCQPYDDRLCATQVDENDLEEILPARLVRQDLVQLGTGCFLGW